MLFVFPMPGSGTSGVGLPVKELVQNDGVRFDLWVDADLYCVHAGFLVLSLGEIVERSNTPAQKEFLVVDDLADKTLEEVELDVRQLIDRRTLKGIFTQTFWAHEAADDDGGGGTTKNSLIFEAFIAKEYPTEFQMQVLKERGKIKTERNQQLQNALLMNDIGVGWCYKDRRGRAVL